MPTKKSSLKKEKVSGASKKIYKEVIGQIDKVFEKNKKRGKYTKLKDEKKDELLNFFKKDPYPSKSEYQNIANQLGESLTKIENWFKHERRSQLENEIIKNKYKKRRLLQSNEEEFLESHFRVNPNPTSKEMMAIGKSLNFRLKVISNWYSYRRSKLLKVTNKKFISLKKCNQETETSLNNEVMEEEKNEKSSEELKKNLLEESVFNSAMGERHEDIKNILLDEKKECGTQTLPCELEQKKTQIEEEEENKLEETKCLSTKEEKVQAPSSVIEFSEKNTMSKVDKEEQKAFEPVLKIEKSIIDRISVKEKEDEKINLEFQKKNMSFNPNHLNMGMNFNSAPFSPFSILNNANIMSQIFRLGWNQWIIRNAMSGYLMNRFPF